MNTIKYNTALEGLRIPATIDLNDQLKKVTITVNRESIFAMLLSKHIKDSYPDESQAFQHLQRIKNSFDLNSLNNEK